VTVLVFSSVQSAEAATITVTNANDTRDGSGNPITGDGVSLREAILSVNGGANVNLDVVADLNSGLYGTNDTIRFNIPAASDPGCVAATGVCTIAVTAGGLPTISKTVTIDGYTQPGASPNTLTVGSNAALKIELNGTSAGSGGIGLMIDAANSSVRGLVINRFCHNSGIIIWAAGSGATITGNYVGTDTSGATAPLGSCGVMSYGLVVDTASDVMIGGTTSDARNVVSGNSQDGVRVYTSVPGGASNVKILGNYLGTNAAGTMAVGNGAGVDIIAALGVVVGGTTPGARNVISGNFGEGVFVGENSAGDAAGAVIRGNLIGTNATGDSAIPNTRGVWLLAPDAVIGGTEAGAGNVISGNFDYGIKVSRGALVQGNFIGTNASGIGGLANGIGITSDFTSTVTIGGTTPGAANVIAFNTGPGVRFDNGTGGRIRGNSTYSNGGLGIDHSGDGVTANDIGDGDTGPNNRQNFPVLAPASLVGGLTRVAGTLQSASNTAFHIDFYSSPSCDPSGHGEGRIYLGSTVTTTDGGGDASFVEPGLRSTILGDTITATATDPAGNTSEFSACQSVVAPGVTVTPIGGLITDETGRTATFTVRMNSVPTAQVTIPVSSGDITEGAINTVALVFAPDATAAYPQTVTITGQDDSDSDGHIGYSIVLGAATSTDGAYGGVNPPDVGVINRDNDTVTCSPRPRVTISTANNGDGRLRVTIGAITPPTDVQNRLRQLQFDAGSNNAIVHLPNQPPRSGAFTYDVPNQPTSFTFYVGREHAGPTHLPFKVIDGCTSQPWPTFVGGGATAF